MSDCGTSSTRKHKPSWVDYEGVSYRVCSRCGSDIPIELNPADDIDADGRIARKLLTDGRMLFLVPMLFTHRLCIGNANAGVMDAYYSDAWCYHTRNDGLKALREWNPLDPATPKPTGWHRHPASGRRRPDGDASREYVNA